MSGNIDNLLKIKDSIAFSLNTVSEIKNMYVYENANQYFNYSDDLYLFIENAYKSLIFAKAYLGIRLSVINRIASPQQTPIAITPIPVINTKESIEDALLHLLNFLQSLITEPSLAEPYTIEIVTNKLIVMTNCYSKIYEAFLSIEYLVSLNPNTAVKTGNEPLG